VRERERERERERRSLLCGNPRSKIIQAKKIFEGSFFVQARATDANKIFKSSAPRFHAEAQNVEKDEKM
jgi:hypothetical protein